MEGLVGWRGAQAVQKAQKEGTDLVLCDTSGRLQNNIGLMEELKTCRQAIAKVAGAPHETLLVLDGTTGACCSPQPLSLHTHSSGFTWCLKGCPVAYPCSTGPELHVRHMCAWCPQCKRCLPYVPRLRRHVRTGRNMLNQAREFNSFVKLTGLVLTKVQTSRFTCPKMSVYLFACGNVTSVTA